MTPEHFEAEDALSFTTSTERQNKGEYKTGMCSRDEKGTDEKLHAE